MIDFRFLHYILPGLPMSKEKQAALEIMTALKGGPGSGNFGHAGRPGEVGGSAGSDSGNNPYNRIATFEKDNWITHIYEVNDATNILKDSRVFAVSIKGKNKHKIIMSDERQSHAQMVETFDNSDIIDNWVRFEHFGGEVQADVLYSGVNDTFTSNWQARAVDNIFNALDVLTSKGLPEDTPVKFYNPQNRSWTHTTAKEFIEVNS